MIPWEPESLESIKARLPPALAVVYDPDDISQGAVRPGEQRQHVFDFQDGVRCIISLDWDHEPPKVGRGTARLHVSFSAYPGTKLFFIDFLNRTAAIPVELWPDTLLLEVDRLVTPKAIHHVYEVPPTWKIPA